MLVVLDIIMTVNYINNYNYQKMNNIYFKLYHHDKVNNFHLFLIYN